MYHLYRQSVPSGLAQVVHHQHHHLSVLDMKPHGRGFDPAHANTFISASYFLQCSFYCNMQLIQFNVYFNYHVHIFMLGICTL